MTKLTAFQRILIGAATPEDLEPKPLRSTIRATEIASGRKRFGLFDRYLSTLRCEVCNDPIDADVAIFDETVTGIDEQELQAVTAACTGLHRLYADVRDEKIQAGFDRSAK